MVEPLADQIMCKAKQAAELYHRLILLIAPAGGGKTATLLEVRERTGAPLVNVTLELSRRMLDLTKRQRSIQLPRLFQEVAGNGGGEMILLDNLEVIFDIGLKQDPLQLLRGLSRNRTVVAAWSGAIVDDSLTYAVPCGNKRYLSPKAADVWPNIRLERPTPAFREQGILPLTS